MRPHIHDESESASGGDHLHRWNADRMRKHLRNVHDIQAPMTWDLGRLHQAHLEDHTSRRAPEPEQTICEAYYGVGDGTAATCQRPAGHPEVSEDGIGHNPQPIPVQTWARKPALRKGEVHDHGGDIEVWHDRVSGVHGNAAESFLALHLINVHDIHPEKGESVYGLHAHAHLTAKAEEAPMTQTPHGHAPADPRVVQGGPALFRHLGAEHGIHNSNEFADPRTLHKDAHREMQTASGEMEYPADRPAAAADQPIPAVQVPSPEAIGRTQAAFVQMATEAALDDEVRAVWAKETGRPEESWPSTTRDTKEHFRRKVRQEQIGYGAASAEHAQREGQRRILVDRFICALAGIDFDNDWAADSGMGPAARGVIRVTYGKPAERLLERLERGGLMPFGPLTDIEQEALDRLKADRDEALARQHEAVEKWQEAVRNGQEQHQSMQAMAQALAESESLVSDLEEINNGLRNERDQARRQFDEVQHDNERLIRERGQAVESGRAIFEEMGELRTRLEDERAVAMRRAQEAEARVSELSTQLDLLSGDLEAVTTMRDGLQAANDRQVELITTLEEQLGEATDERDRAQQALMTKLSEAAELREEVQLLRRAVSTVTETSRLPVEPEKQPEIIESGSIWDWGRSMWIKLGPEEDDLTWARRFAAGE